MNKLVFVNRFICNPKAAFSLFAVCCLAFALSGCSEKIRNEEEMQAFKLVRNELLRRNQQDSIWQELRKQEWLNKLAAYQTASDTTGLSYEKQTVNNALAGYQAFDDLFSLIRKAEKSIENGRKSNPGKQLMLTPAQVKLLEEVELKTQKLIGNYLPGNESMQEPTFLFGIKLVSRNPKDNWITSEVNLQSWYVAELFFTTLRKKLYVVRKQFMEEAERDFRFTI